MEISSVKVLFQIGPVMITNTMLYTWIIMAIILIACVLLARKLTLVPESKSQVVAEMLVGTMRNFVSSSMSPEKVGFAPYFAALISFIALSNLSGFLFLGFVRPPTADWATTLGLALITFFMIEGFGIKSNGIKNWLKGFVDPTPVILPINIIGEFATPVSLSFRLFGNILGGMIITTLVYQLYVNNVAVVCWTLAAGLILTALIYTKKTSALKKMSKGTKKIVIFVAVILMFPALAASGVHFYFDLFAGLLQAFIFTMLSMIFVNNAM